MKAVVVTPNASDATLAGRFLADHGMETLALSTVAALEGMDSQSIGCIVLVEETLAEDSVATLQLMLREQPPWSDLPLIVFASEGSAFLGAMPGLFPYSGNVTLLQRPIHPASLVSAVDAAQRSRARQLQVRDLLAQRESAVRQRDEFLAMLAHELRNPLTPIRNAVYLLGTMRHDDPLFIKCRAMIDKQARHITRLVDDLLDISRLELGKVELRPLVLDMNDSVAAAVESCGAATAARRHSVKLVLASGALTVRADPVRLEQAVCNLILNAAKFTPDGGTIEVETRDEEGFAVVAVTDDGIGIKPEMIESIFNLFTQEAVPLARTQGGLGIGLTLVKRLVELHGGSVSASSEGLGTGSCFEARLPLEANARAGAQAETPLGEAPRRRVLIVEDGADNRDSLAMLMRAWNHEVYFAGTGPEGLDRARETQPDVALIDIGLPGIDGYQVAQGIRGEGSPWSRDVRLIALTGYGQGHDRARALEAGFDVHVLKPIDPVELHRLLVHDQGPPRPPTAA